jgi:hypothetical protein
VRWRYEWGRTVARFILAAVLPDQNGSRWWRCLEWLRAVSGSPQLGLTLSIVPVDDKASR